MVINQMFLPTGNSPNVLGFFGSQKLNNANYLFSDIMKVNLGESNNLNMLGGNAVSLAGSFSEAEGSNSSSDLKDLISLLQGLITNSESADEIQLTGKQSKEEKLELITEEKTLSEKETQNLLAFLRGIGLVPKAESGLQNKSFGINYADENSAKSDLISEINKALKEGKTVMLEIQTSSGILNLELKPSQIQESDIVASASDDSEELNIQKAFSSVQDEPEISVKVDFKDSKLLEPEKVQTNNNFGLNEANGADTSTADTLSATGNFSATGDLSATDTFSAENELLFGKKLMPEQSDYGDVASEITSSDNISEKIASSVSFSDKITTDVSKEKESDSKNIEIQKEFLQATSDNPKKSESEISLQANPKKSESTDKNVQSRNILEEMKSVAETKTKDENTIYFKLEEKKIAGNSDKNAEIALEKKDSELKFKMDLKTGLQKAKIQAENDKPIGTNKPHKSGIVSDEVKSSTIPLSNSNGKDGSILKTVQNQVHLKNESIPEQNMIQGNSTKEAGVISNSETGSHSQSQNESNTGKGFNFGKDFESIMQKIDNKVIKENNNNQFKEMLNNSITEKSIISEKPKLINAVNLVKELSNFIHRNEEKSLVIKLEPEHLGKLKITLEQNEKSVHAHIEVTNEAARKLVESNIKDLQQSVLKNGVDLGSVNISLSDQNHQNERSHFGENKNNSSNSKNLNYDESVLTEENERSTIRRMGYNTVEYLA